MFLYTKIIIIKTNNPKETKAKPIAQPARYAVLNAEASDFLAQYVVLKLAWVAIIIPTAPHIIDTKAPIKNDIPVFIPYSVKNIITMNIIKANTRHIKYSTFKNYFAPFILYKFYFWYFCA